MKNSIKVNYIKSKVSTFLSLKYKVVLKRCQSYLLPKFEKMSRHQELQDTDSHTFCRDMKNTLIVYQGTVFLFLSLKYEVVLKRCQSNPFSKIWQNGHTSRIAGCRCTNILQRWEEYHYHKLYKVICFFLSFLQIWSSSEKMSIQCFFLNLTKWPNIRNLQDTDAYILERCEEYHYSKLYRVKSFFQVKG